MKHSNFFVFIFILVEIYGQRIRTSSMNQDVTNEQPQTPRGMGRSRFSSTEEFAQIQDQTERTATNRRIPSKTRINPNNPKTAVDRRARPTETPNRGHAVEEINNDSPIESFRRQSKSRALSDDVLTVTVSRRPIEASTILPVAALPVENLGFGSTARAILQARGQPLPVQTTTPVVNEEYLRANFGSTIRSLAATGRNAVPVPLRRAPPPQRAVLRSETPILNRDDIPARRTSLRADPLPLLRSSHAGLDKNSVRNGGRSRNRDTKVNINPEIERTTSERTVVEDFVRIDPEEGDPQLVKGLPEHLESITESEAFETVTVLPDEDNFKKTSSVEATTARTTPLPTIRRVLVNNRRNNGRARIQDEPEDTISRGRGGSRTRVRIEEPTIAPRARANRRRLDDAEVAESRDRGPSVFTAEHYVTARTRAGRRIDTRYEVLPQVAQTTTLRSRNAARRVEITTQQTASSRSRGRFRSNMSEINTSKPNSRRGSRGEESITSRSSVRETTTSSSRNTSSVVEKAAYTRRANIKANGDASLPSRWRGGSDERSKEANHHANTRSPNSSDATVRGSRHMGRFESPEIKRETISRSLRKNSARSRSSPARQVENSEEPTTTSERSRSSPAKQIENSEETTIYYGEKSRKNVPEITTVLPIETTSKSNFRLRSRNLDSPLKIDESKLEVLPLFERESKYVSSTRRGLKPKFNTFLNDHMHGSATENDVRFVEKPTTNAFPRMTVTRTESVEASTSRAKLSTRTAGSTISSSVRRSTEAIVTAPETTIKLISTATPIIRETVVSEINQVTSKSTITRRKKMPKAKTNEVLSRGSKKSDVKFNNTVKRKDSEEDIEEGDNYPEPFKALIQAKKLTEEPRTLSPSVARITTSAPPVKAINTERIFVTSAGASRGSSAVTTTTVASRKLPKLNEIINETENELDPKAPSVSTTAASAIATKPSRSSQLPSKLFEKSKYQSKSREKVYKSTSRVTQTLDNITAKTTSVPRKAYTRNSSDYHSRRKVLRSTAVPPSTTPVNFFKENKFSAKFIKKEGKEISNGENSDKNLSDVQGKGLYSNRNGKESEADEEKIIKQLDVSLIQSSKADQPIKKLNSSRYSSRFRSDTSTRSSVLKTTTTAPFYIPTIPTPAYIPTVPTVTPSTIPEDGIQVETDESGLQIISFDVPVRGVLTSADLVNGELLATDKNLKLSPLVKDGTTEKPVSIIERIINSITLIPTTEVLNNGTDQSTIPDPSENSAILKLANKKPTIDKTDVQTNIIETITSEKPTTIIEKIRSSLSAIQTNEVGTEDIFVSSSTTPLSTVTKYSARYRGSSTALPAPLPLSTTITPSESQVLEKNTIGRLLNILNGLVATEPPAGEKVIVVTPKSAGFVATTFSTQEPIEAITPNSPSALTFVNTDISTDSSTVNSKTTTLLVDSTETLPDIATEVVRYTETPTSVTPTSNFTEVPLSTTTSIVDRIGSTIYSFPSIPSHPNINVSPGSVSIFSANDLSNYITPDYNRFNTVTIASTVGFDNNVLTTDSTTTTEGTTESATSVITTVESDLTTTEVISTTTDIMSTTTDIMRTTTNIMSTTTGQDEATTMLTPTTVNNILNNRSGKILSNDIGAPVDNNIDSVTPSTTTSTTPDYFVFAVLNNNTILRKRPPTVPNKETPFIIVGLYPNNTIVRKFPNGTLVPMDPVIKVRGFDTRPNPPPLVEITSNQVTDTNANGMTTPEDNNSATNESNRMARLLENGKISTTSLTTNSRVSTTTTLITKSLVTTTAVSSSTSPSSTNMPSTTSFGSDLSSTTLDTSTTDLLSTLPPSTTITPAVEIMAVPGATRISKSQTTAMPSTITSEMSSATRSSETIPSTLSEILNGRTVDALNKIISSKGSSTTENYKAFNINKDSVSSTTELSTMISTTAPAIETDSPSSPTQSIDSTTTLFPNTVDRLASSTLVSTLMPASTTTTETTTQPTTTTTVRTTTKPPVRKTTARSIATTAKTVTTTTGFPIFSSSTIVPSILTTFFSSLMGTTPKNRISSTRKALTSAELTNSIADNFEVLSTAGSTARTSAALPQSSTLQKISTTTASTSSTPSTTTTQTTTTTTSKPITIKPKTTTVMSTKEETDKLFEELKKSGKLKNLSEEQRKNLEEIERIEKEQADLIKQLTMLTSMFGGQRGKIPNLASLNNPVEGSSNTLANRVVSMAIEREKNSKSEAPITQKPTTKRPNSIQDQLPLTSAAEESTRKTTPSLEEILKQYNLEGLSTLSPLSSTYGKTDDALLASILKSQGIGPTTPKALGDKVKEAGIFEQAASTKKPKPKAIPTTARPALGGRLMQGLNWLLDILDPPTTKKPAPRKPKAKPAPAKQNSGDEELLSNQPTRITPMITAAPVRKPSLSQDEIRGLIRQLENAQKNPNSADQLDFSKIKSLQNLIDVNDAVEITHLGQHDATSKGTSRPQRGKASTDKDPFLQTVNRKTKSSTIVPSSVSNSIDHDLEIISTTTRPRGMQPVSLNPIPGIDDQGDSMIRSNLLTAAVNVTRAISSFIGSAFQDATHQFRAMFSNGSSGLSTLSAGSSIPNIAAVSRRGSG